MRTVTPRSSATVRNRTISAESSSGSSSNGADGGQSITGISRPKVKNPTARCAMGDTLITTGAAAGGGDGTGDDEPRAT
ncbi:hypothetical protein MAHJHV34_14850 [Mycobacterium avium subsp. hominissuis]